MSIYKVRMVAFGDNDVRHVKVPRSAKQATTNVLLEIIFSHGQNDMEVEPTLIEWFAGSNPKPSNMRSVSVGDVIEFDDGLYLVKNLGFAKITEDEYQEHIKKDLLKRVLGG